MAAVALMIAALAVFQVLAAGRLAAIADGAAEAAAIAVVNGRDPGDAARAAAPGWARDRVRVREREGRVTVTLAAPAVLRIVPGAAPGERPRRSCAGRGSDVCRASRARTARRAGQTRRARIETPRAGARRGRDRAQPRLRHLDRRPWARAASCRRARVMRRRRPGARGRARGRRRAWRPARPRAARDRPASRAPRVASCWSPTDRRIRGSGSRPARCACRNRGSECCCSRAAGVPVARSARRCAESRARSEKRSESEL